jgi:hypothetical protein
VIKALLADALGMHLDMFQRIVVEPCSVSVVAYRGLHPAVLRMNDVGGRLDGLRPPPAAAAEPARLGGGDGGAGAPVDGGQVAAGGTDDAIGGAQFAHGEAEAGAAATDG